MTTSETQFEFYSSLANQNIPETMKNGRYPIQESAEKRIVPDVIGKLSPNPEDTFLDIGFGTGTILVPFSFIVREAFGIDNANAVANLSKSNPRANVSLFAGEFPKIELPRREFSLIAAYSVLHALPSRAAIHEFVRSAASLLSPGGKVIFGDIPNTDLKDRFQASAAGKAFEETWREQMGPLKENEIVRGPQAADPVPFDDKMIMDILLILRGMRLDAYVMRQDPNLPFGNTREDIVATKRA